MSQHAYLTVAEVLEIHRIVIEEFGGSAGVRDRAALEAAVFRPQSGYYENLVQEAAALMESLINNHPFVDGNKRVGFVATDAMLRINGHFIEADSDAAFEFINGSLERHSLNWAAISDWLSAVVQPL